MSDSDKRAIEEMARDICHLPRRCEECDISRINKGKCQARTYAERAYKKGWRKQEVSHEPR
jgi:radical SAM protein with 4Fe4S-binding SPASM domain